MAQEIFLGTKFKLNIEITPIDGVTLDDYDFEIDVWASSKKVAHYTKMDTIKVDSNNRMIRVDTEELGAGDLKYKIRAIIPDGDFPDGVRPEVYMQDTGLKIVKTI